ncbi:MAG: hypothetical protein Q9187_002118 [Circinaria calcarea]
MDRSPQDLRSRALQKIAALSAISPLKPAGQSDLVRLCNVCPSRRAGRKTQPNGLGNDIQNDSASLSEALMTLEELHTLLALCKASPLLDDYEGAQRLVTQLSPYLLEAHSQTIAPSPFLRSIEPSPWEALTYNLVASLLAIGIKHPSLGDDIHNCITHYLQNCRNTVDVVIGSKDRNTSDIVDLKSPEILYKASVAVSILGFLEAASAYLYFFTTSQKFQIVTLLRQIFNEDFMVSVEGAFSSIRTSNSVTRSIRDWKYFTKHYASSGRPLGATLLQRGFMRLLVSCSSMQVATTQDLQHDDILEILLSKEQLLRVSYDEENTALTQLMSDIAEEEMHLLEDGADYLQLGSAWQQRLAFAVKRYALITSLNCMLGDEEMSGIDDVISWLEDTMDDPIQMADADLASTVLKSMAIVAKASPAIASTLGRSLPRFIVQGGIRGLTVAVAARCLAYVLRLLSQDAVITGLYSLGNVLSAGSSAEKGIGSSTARESILGVPKNAANYTHQVTGSAISLALNGDEDTSAVYKNVVRTIVCIAATCRDDKITALAQSMLLQKLGRVSLAVDLHIITETAKLVADGGGQVDLKSLLKLYARFCHDGFMQGNVAILEAITQAQVLIAESLSPDSPLYIVYLSHLLETIISKGDVQETESTRQADFELAAQEIAQLLRPWAILAPAQSRIDGEVDAENIATLQREAWFNIVVHGITPDSTLYQEHYEELRVIAIHSQPLIAEDRADQAESDIDLNSILRRGMNGPHTTEMKKRLIKLLGSQESNIKALTYPRVIFLSAAYLVETLRADAGSCAHILSYFLDPGVNRNEMGSCMAAVADQVMTLYLRRTLNERFSESSATHVAKQLAMVLKGCCHRIMRVQQVAVKCADRIITQMPSSLCQTPSLFTLLELLTIMWSSCLEAEIDEYEWKSTHISTLADISLELSDDYDFRKMTLEAFYKRSRTWMMTVINVAPLDIKGLLQTYLSDYDDDGAYGHIALGRSFALEMGSVIPSTDHKLGAIDCHGEANINTGSDFIAQYTTRQEYRYADALPGSDTEWMRLLYQNGKRKSAAPGSDHDIEDAQAILTLLARRVAEHKFISIGELRDVLRRAAALLCRSNEDQCAIVHHLVNIPFAMFTKQSIKLGISLWLGVINENPRMEPRILVELAENWQQTVQNKLGIFNDMFQHLDPFYIKEEFAPSDKSVLLKRQQAAHSLIAPHLRILQLLTSHFNANRLGSPHLRRIFQRLIRKTLQGLKHASRHPLAREIYFQVILFAIRILTYSDDLGDAAKWRLKDSILSSALAWFSRPPSWSFGGNRLQIKAEVRLLVDIELALVAVASIGSNATRSLQSLTTKHDLLVRLLDDEHMRLHAASSSMLKAAWAQSPGLAIQTSKRFRSPSLAREIRQLLLDSPQRAIGEPDALHIMLGDTLPSDLSFQLKYLLYWAPVNPITAVTYFLPAFGNHPFILQYAMRVLESHSVDVTFFYVPQIVQTLRYDALGYVQQYIIETAKFSQLFAHQIIWNMKANAYKDEDSTVEDPLKPTLDKVTSNMIASFSGIDRAFYEREFQFFNEITDISGKLRPFIKKSKPEKKQKIEEELRKIKVEVGVYLPSNPDGVVIGIDRKSGKPLQSHAKAPYMATFRIKKNKGGMEETDVMLEETNLNESTDREDAVTHEATYEVWQSAIFKVGDDCRQDILALQMIAAFRGIFNNVGLDVYVYPYRVTATAPGCGVIDVLPNAISRDMVGREAVNGLYDYFVSKYGNEESIRFQEARSNFVKSMAAYSVISYLLQFKDRHNGNIMVDEAGHILHIDFGFCFDIAPGGVKFERAPFKLTSEMVAVMGGSTASQSFRWFEELCVKAFLASRPYTRELCHMVVLMIDSGLPCFKPETIKHFRERMVLEKSEREAADFMRFLIRKSYNSYSTGVYDGFQLLTNGIPY